MDASALALFRALPVTRTVTGNGMALPARAGEVGLVPEYALLAARQQLAQARLLSGTDNTALLHFTWLPTATGASAPGRAALQRLLSALTGPDADRARDAARLRGPSAAAPPGGDHDPLPAPTAKPFEVLQPHHVDHVLATWYKQDRRTNLLIVVDVSGSMAAPAAGSREPLINLVRQGCVAIGTLLPNDSGLGLWEFGSRLDPPHDYRTLIAPAPLAARRQTLPLAVAKLTARPTGTGLYDTILAAYLAAESSYRSGMLNQILVFTDGRNEDDPGSISAGQLATKLAEAKDPRRPVQVSVPAFGSLPDIKVLTGALKPVDGYVDWVRTAQDVSAVFVHLAAGGLDAD